MRTELRIKNIVLIGGFNPSYFDKFFFIKNKIFDENEILKNSNFGSLGVVNLLTTKIQLIISPNQIIITSQIPEDDSVLLNNILLKIIIDSNLLNISAVGINFQWSINDETKKIEELSKELFYNKNNKLTDNFFNTDDSRYGIYLSKNYLDSRLKLDIKPVFSKNLINNTEEDFIQFGFNFHFDIKSDDKINKISKILNDYHSYESECIKLATVYN